MKSPAAASWYSPPPECVSHASVLAPQPVHSAHTSTTSSPNRSERVCPSPRHLGHGRLILAMCDLLRVDGRFGKVMKLLRSCIAWPESECAMRLFIAPQPRRSSH